MKRHIVFLCFLLVAVLLPAQLVNRFTIDLTKSRKNKLSVRCEVPAYEKEVLVYQIPRAVPGSYSIKNFGDYVANFKAYDRNGKKLKVAYNKQDNTFTIENARSLTHIDYDVHDTWTDIDNPNYVFAPGGTYFECGTLFCLNTFALCGYFDGFEHLANEIRIKKESGLYCSTSADRTALSPTEDLIRVPDYDALQDNPLVYMVPDTVSLQVNNCRFHIAVFSRNHKITSQQILSSIRPILTRLFPSFFPKFPMSSYTFTFIFPGWQDDNLMKNGGVGAMEHRNSSVYFYPETGNSAILNAFLTHVVVHEFLHVLTPLSLKSEPIFRFNYRNPAASQHLWLYEGGVEYLANQFLLRDSILSENDYLESVRQKLLYSDRYKQISMTEFGRKIFENSDPGYYANVYNRGALVAFLLDVRINELTDGRMNLRKLLFQLDEEYKGRYFQDDKLFDEIVSRTHPEIRSLIDDYIVGTEELPVKAYLHKIGYKFSATMPDSIYTFGRVSVEYDSRTNRCVVRDATPNYNAFNLDKGDLIVAVNDTMLNEANYYQYLKLIGNPDSEKELKVRFARKGKMMEIQNPPVKIKVTQLNYIEPERDLTPEQQRLRRLVLGR
jgi:predicted metalloprotease with PDZ domain